jgi:hypothetical protein
MKGWLSQLKSLVELAGAIAITVLLVAGVSAMRSDRGSGEDGSGERTTGHDGCQICLKRMGAHPAHTVAVSQRVTTENLIRASSAFAGAYGSSTTGETGGARRSR